MLIRTTWNFDFDFSLSFCVFIEMVNNHFKIISHYWCHMNSSFVLSYYNTTQNMYDTYFLSIEFSSLLLVTSWIRYVSMWQYAPNTKKLNHHKIRLRNVENWLIVERYLNVHLCYGILVRKYKNVTITLQKEQENPLKICFCFQSRDKIVSGSTEVFQGGTIPMPTGRHIDNW